MSVEKDLLVVLKIKGRKKTEDLSMYLQRITKACKTKWWAAEVGNEDNEHWESLSDDAQQWVNDAVMDSDSGKEIAEFPVEEEPESKEETDEAEETLEIEAETEDDQEETEEIEKVEAPPKKQMRKIKITKAQNMGSEASNSKKPEKPAKSTATKKPVKTKTDKKKREFRSGTKVEIIAKLLLRKDGCTSADVKNATGWPAVSMPAMAKACGLQLRKEKVQGTVTRYYGVS